MRSCINTLIVLALLIALRKYAPDMFDIVMEIVMKMLLIVRQTLDDMSS